LRGQIFENEDSNLFVIGMVAAFEQRKDYKTLIKAALSLVKTNAYVRFLLIGDGHDLGQIKNSVPVEFRNKILFLGRRNDVESIVNLFDIGILLTNSKVHGEGISNSIIEYMALGKPVIATRGGGTNEVVIDNENGYLVNAEDSNQLVESVQKLMNNKNLLEKFGSKSCELAHRVFDLKIMTRNYIEMYRQVLQEKES
jgi:glycosyltransferase involved in cell wall biosynthesis